MLNREDWLMIREMRGKGCYLHEIAERVGGSERTVRRALKRGGPPLSWRLYLPREWAEDVQRRSQAGLHRRLVLSPRASWSGRFRRTGRVICTRASAHGRGALRQSDAAGLVVGVGVTLCGRDCKPRLMPSICPTRELPAPARLDVASRSAVDPKCTFPTGTDPCAKPFVMSLLRGTI